MEDARETTRSSHGKIIKFDHGVIPDLSYSL